MIDTGELPDDMGASVKPAVTEAWRSKRLTAVAGVNRLMTVAATLGSDNLMRTALVATRSATGVPRDFRAQRDREQSDQRMADALSGRSGWAGPQ